MPVPLAKTVEPGRHRTEVCEPRECRADFVAVRKLFDTVAARFSDRRGGYTRIIRAGQRHGDGASMAILEFVDRPESPKEKKKGKEKAAESKGKEAKKQRKAAAAVGR